MKLASISHLAAVSCVSRMCTWCDITYNPSLVSLVYQFLSENVPAFVRTEEDGDREEEESLAPLEQDPVIVSVTGQKRKASS
jgi:hypothetical protein